MAATRRAVGILGGMGPEATVDLFGKIVRATPATRDRDHLRILVDCLPQIPDRTAAILGHGPSPAPLLVAAARRLEAWGAQVIVMPCNTAHFYHDLLAGAVKAKVLHIMDETAAHITRFYPEARSVGVLASSGTAAAGLYKRSLSRAGLEEVFPGPADQDSVMQAIYLVKAGQHDRAHVLLKRVAATLVAQGARAMVAGCTEVPLVLGAGDLEVPFVDATLALAEAAVRYALGKEEGCP